jgi:hypothetical protein
MKRFALSDLRPELQQQVVQQLHPPVVGRIPDPIPQRKERARPLGGPKAKGESPARTVVIITRCSTRSLDRDNLIGGVKTTCDSLRYSGYIDGDTEADIELFVFQKKVPRDKIGTLIEIVKIPLQPKG